MSSELFGQHFFHGVLLSLALGSVVGLVRQWSDQQDTRGGEATAGLRTFALWALLGFVFAILGESPESPFYIAGFIVFSLSLMAIAWRVGAIDWHALGATSVAAGTLTFLSGSILGWGFLRPAMALVAGTSVILAIKPFAHRWTEKLTAEDIYLLLQFVAVSVLILPVLPDVGYGPLEAFNPYKTWLMVVLISGLGFVGYVAVRWVGANRGLLLTGVAGGLASSTATTLAFSRASRNAPQLAEPLAMGIVLASTIMVGRVWLIIVALDRSLAFALAVPLCAMALPSVAVLIWFFGRNRTRGELDLDAPFLKNPLSLRMAIKFALIYAVIVLLVKLSQAYGSEGSFYPLAFLSGLTDMDAIALSLANEHLNADLWLNLAARGIVLGAIANTLFKLSLVLFLGHSSLRRSVALGMVPMILGGAVGMALVGFFF